MAEQRGAKVLGELLGSGCANDSQGLLAIDDEGEALADAIRFALEDARLRPTDVGMIVAHANGTRQSDVSEAAALRARVPP